MILNFHKSRTIPISDIIKNPCSVLISANQTFACRCIVDGPSEILHNEEFDVGKLARPLNWIFSPRPGSWATLTIIAEPPRQPNEEPYELLLEIQESRLPPAQKN